LRGVHFQDVAAVSKFFGNFDNWATKQKELAFVVIGCESTQFRQKCVSIFAFIHAITNQVAIAELQKKQVEYRKYLVV
jgi:hypothetical protein